MSAPTARTGPAETAKLLARLREHIALDVGVDGKTTARFPGYAVELGTLGADAAALSCANDVVALSSVAQAKPARTNEFNFIRLLRNT